ncbi:MAG: hypothetical protein J6S14_18495 [Clostridia bacterium]|nr:hypothetical protein [Clostridia bacterium]
MIRTLKCYTYNEDNRYSELVGLSSDVKPVSGLVTGSKFTEVDTGIVYLFDEDSEEWFAQNSGNGKTLITGATVVLGSALTYDGTEKTKTVTSVTVGETVLVADTDYKVKNNKGTYPGTYYMQIIGIGSYTGVINEDWSIGKGSGSVTASPDSLALTEGGDDGESTLTVVGDGVITVSSSATAVATASLADNKVIISPVAEGSATITVTLADGTLYNGGTDTISVTVEAAAEGE